MPTFPDLESFLGKNIKSICGNGFGDPNANHCAHFVSHAMGFTFSFNCKNFVGGSKPGANIRVHEVFAQCPRVGKWSDADKTKNQLVFVTRKDVVDLATKTMQNIPQKHIGIFHNGNIYHYSNGSDKVVKQSPSDFLDRFQAIYAGDQGLFFGEFPGSDLNLTVSMTAAAVGQPAAPAFQLEKEGSRWFATPADSGQRFFVGKEIAQPAKKFFGLFHPVEEYYGPLYDPANYFNLIDRWAYLLDVTAICESKGRFNLINTYDRARFTFGFYQLAAHTPNDNLILLFRQALLDPEFGRLFPDLQLRGGKVFRVAQDGTATDLEEEFDDAPTGERQIKNFMAYLNPRRLEIDDQEILQSARAVWWANNSAAGRELQVKTANAILQRKMTKIYQPRYDLDGQSDIVCAIVADIHHQGRGKKAEVKAALASSSKVKQLLKIGKADYPERIEALSARIEKWRADQKLGVSVYRASTNEFALSASPNPQF